MPEKAFIHPHGGAPQVLAAGDLEKTLMKRRHNNRVWLMRLPEELLVKIFKLYISEETKKADTFTTTNDNSSESWRRIYKHQYPDAGRWAAILPHVCHSWRELVVQSPILWDQIVVDGSKLDRLDEHIQRSGATMPLTVRGYFHKDHLKVLSTLWGRIFQEAARIESLRLDVAPSQDALFSTHHQLQFPQLQSLFLKTPNNGGQTLPSLVSQPGAFPSLKVLHSVSYSFTALLPLFTPTLRKIDIACALKRPSPYSRAMLLDALRAMPQLEVLRLQNSIPQDGHATPVVLPFLEKIYLLDYGASCVSLLEQLIFPATTVISLELEAAPYACGGTRFGLSNEHGDNHDLVVYAPYVGQRMEGKNMIGPIPPIVSLSINWRVQHDWFSDFPTTDDVYVRGWPTPVPLVPAKTIAQEPSFYLNTEDWGYSHVLSQFVEKTLPLQSVRVLLIDGAFRSEQAALGEWLMLFRKMTAVQELYIEGAAAHGFAEALQQDGAGQSKEHLFPSLQVLKFKGLQLYDTNAPRSRSCPPLDESWIFNLKQALHYRQRTSGTRLRKLVIEKGWNVRQHHINVIVASGCIDRVEWDGVYQVPEVLYDDLEGMEGEEEYDAELDGCPSGPDSEIGIDREDDEETKRQKRVAEVWAFLRGMGMGL